MTNRHEDLVALLHALNLPQMASEIADLALTAAREGMSHEAFVYLLAQHEDDARTQRRITRRTKEAGLPLEKTLRSLELPVLGPLLVQQIDHLCTGTFVKDAVNVIALGRPGTGKSHVSAALGHQLIAQGQTVGWSSAAMLVQRLLAAKRDLCLPREIAKLDRFACLIIDDIGYIQQGRDEMEVFFTLLAERYERRSVILTTNLVFSEWERIFKDPMTTMAAIDRVVHHSVILDFMGLESYRVKAAQHAQRQARGSGAAASA